MTPRLRYDLVVEAITTLRRYVDSCSEEVNTLALINSASKTLTQLKQIESGIQQSKAVLKPYKSDVVSALAEVESAIEGMKEQTAFIQSFMEEHKEPIQAMKAIISASSCMSDILTTMKGLDRQLRDLRQNRISAI